MPCKRRSKDEISYFNVAGSVTGCSIAGENSCGELFEFLPLNHRRKMNSTSTSDVANNSCKVFLMPEYIPQFFLGNFNVFFVIAAVIESLSCPFIVLLNALVIVAVKTKRRLQTHLNILLASLALTDLMVGLIVQPLHITTTVFHLQGKDPDEVCKVMSAFLISFVSFSSASLFHLALISVERYLAIKHTFIHRTVVTKRRLMIVTILVWSVIPLRVVLANVRVVSLTFQGAIVIFMILVQVLVYREAREHEKKILSNQVSLEARAKFKKEKKALKLTTTIILAIGLCYVPTFVLVFISGGLMRFRSSTLGSSFYHVSVLPMIFNSLLNPVIYTVRKKQFRIAFVELIFKKDFQGAKQIERRLFGSPNIVEPETDVKQ